jgi:hypothetical protein
MTSNYYVEHAKVDMPHWILHKLKVVNDVLELHLREQELQMRFAFQWCTPFLHP